MSAYVCSFCENEYEETPDWTDADAHQEALDGGLSPDTPPEELVAICDPCFRAIALLQCMMGATTRGEWYLR